MDVQLDHDGGVFCRQEVEAVQEVVGLVKSVTNVGSRHSFAGLCQAEK